MLLGAFIAIAVTMLLALVRALRGPSVYDRVLAVNMFGTKTVLLLSLVSFAVGRTDYLDLALAYALINFIGVLAVLEFFRQRTDGPDAAQAPAAMTRGGGETSGDGEGPSGAGEGPGTTGTAGTPGASERSP